MAHQRSLLPDTRSRFERFIEFHGQHPEVFEMFAAFARKARGAGLQRYSARAIWERLRWHYRIEKGDADFKLNDHFPPLLRPPADGDRCDVRRLLRAA